MDLLRWSTENSKKKKEVEQAKKKEKSWENESTWQSKHCENVSIRLEFESNK